MFKVEITEQDERELMDIVASKMCRYMMDKRMSEIIGVVTKQVAEDIKKEITESGKVDEKVDAVVKRIEQALVSRTQKQMTEIINTTKTDSKNLSPDAKRMRDTLIATMIGYQNEIGNDVNSEAYKAYQRVLELLEKDYGEFMH